MNELIISTFALNIMNRLLDTKIQNNQLIGHVMQNYITIKTNLNFNCCSTLI